jgi:hypothetical protein
MNYYKIYFVTPAYASTDGVDCWLSQGKNENDAWDNLRENWKLTKHPYSLVKSFWKVQIQSTDEPSNSKIFDCLYTCG